MTTLSSELPKTVHGTPDWTKMPTRPTDAPRYLSKEAAGIFAGTPWHRSARWTALDVAGAAEVADRIRAISPNGYGVFWSFFDISSDGQVKIARSRAYACEGGDLIVYGADGLVSITHPSTRVLRFVVDVEETKALSEACDGWACPSGTYDLPA